MGLLDRFGIASEQLMPNSWRIVVSCMGIWLAVTVHVTGKDPPVTPAALVAPVVPSTEMTRITSPATSVEEIPTPTSKRPRLEGKGKEKAVSRASSIWDDAELTVERAHEVVTAEDLKVFSGVPSNEVVARHVHRLV